MPKYRCFSCPQIPYDVRTAKAIAVSHARGVVELLSAKSGDVLDRRTSGVHTLLDNWMLAEPPFETVWDLAFGRVFRAIESDSGDAVDAFAEVALHLSACSQTGNWGATLSRYHRLRWAKRWLLPACTRIAVESDGIEAVITLETMRGRQRFRFERDENGWRPTENEALVDRIIEAGDEQKILILPSYAVPNEMIVEDDFHSIFDFPEVSSATAELFTKALRLIAAHAPDYVQWVTRMVYAVLACRCHESRTRSSSWMHVPGVILVSASPHPMIVAEMLIHEASHQYFHLLSRLGPVEDGSDKQTYYSPAVQRNRSLSRILIGYHAFANVLLFYRALLAANPGDAECREMEARMREDVEELERPLRDNPALTEIGRDLCAPLMEQILVQHERV